MDDLAQFRQTFFTECEELLGDLEGHLMTLQAGEGDINTLNAVFRAIHSVKGGAGAFGFDRLVNFAHIFETVLDLMRDGRLEPTPDSVLLVLRCADILSDLVRAAQNDTELPPDHEDEGRKALIALAASIGVNADPNAADDELAALDAQLAAGGPDAVIAAAASAEPEPAPAAAAAPAKAPLLKYLVKFTPRDALYQRANEPLILIRELRELGGFLARADASTIPPFDQMQAEGAYIKWEFEIETDKGEQAIRDVFEFVLDDCELEVTCLNPPAEAAAPASEAPAKAEAAEPSPAPTAAAVTATPKPQAAAAGTAPKAEAAKPAGTKPAGAKAEGAAPEGGKAVRSIRVDLDRVDKLVNMVGELVITHAMIAQQTEHLHADQHPELANGLAELSHHIRDLQESVMAMRAQPVKSVFARLPRLVRELAVATNKKIRLDMSGENTEIDKTVIEQLGDPLTHMIRNSCDHGIETPEERIAAGKPAEGVIHVSADQRGGRIVIEISDDGRGINRDKVMKKALEKKLIPPDAVLSNEEIDNLIFLPGFSTADTVSNISGRGVGMDVVRQNIQSLGGRVHIQSRPGQGSSFILTLPLTLAVLDGMVLKVGDQSYILPLANIVESLRPEPDQINMVANSSEVLRIRGEYVPLVYLHRIFKVQNGIDDPTKALVIIVELEDGSKMGLVVDEIIGQQQVVIKSLEENFDPIRGVGAATILGNGRVSLILDVAGIKHIAENETQRPGNQNRQLAAPALQASA
ncbi:MAG TPA: chemotaxis protein CheA [Ferrovibrio sp.]|uniref:chemotaxis protein CheA n=1 Tax=Ferrovibrio sp. TaxID=1917215 RepID=UPI002B4AD460|nr:chemotaxis protein CheA [Ferrovibrio sp.]HLT77055.1 chemotaxis protein CheA [Ferrovibrio sp.]